MDGSDAGTTGYKVEDGATVGTTVAGSGNTFLVTAKEYGDFILEMDIRPSARTDRPARESF